MCIRDRCVYEDTPWWEKALKDPKEVYPKTVAYINTKMDNMLATQYLGFLKKGIKLGHKEHCKLYAYQSEPKFLVLHLICCGKSGSCMRVIAMVLSERLPGRFPL